MAKRSWISRRHLGSWKLRRKFQSKEVPIDYVVPQPAVEVCMARAAGREEGVPPLALPGASPLHLAAFEGCEASPMLLRAEDHGSPDFPPVCFLAKANRRSSDSPAEIIAEEARSEYRG